MPIRGFLRFVREQGVVGLTIGFMLGGALSKLTAAIVNDIINPLIGLAINTANLRDKAWLVGQSHIMWGDLLATTIDFIVLAAVVYFGFKLLQLERLDRKRE
jgi:large conductance mechanosensitive channel